MTNENLKLISRWISDYKWSENSGRSDAVLTVTVSPYVDGCVADHDLNRLLRSVTKDDILDLVESLIIERTDTYHIDSACITMDGDGGDTEITIKAEIHLAE